MRIKYLPDVILNNFGRYVYSGRIATYKVTYIIEERTLGIHPSEPYKQSMYFDNVKVDQVNDLRFLVNLIIENFESDKIVDQSRNK